MMKRLLFVMTAATRIWMVAVPALAQAPAPPQDVVHDVNALAKETQNPVGG